MAPATQSPIHRSPLHHWHVARGARLAESDGWLLPSAYSSPSEEAEAVRHGMGLADVSPLSKWCLRGSGVPAVASILGIAALRSVAVVADASFMACRLTQESLVLLSSTTSLVEPAAISLSAANVVRTDVTCEYAGFAVVGKEVETLLRGLTALDVSARALPQGSCAETNLAGVHALLVRPPARLVDQISVYVAWDVSEYVWERLCVIGARIRRLTRGAEAYVNLTPIGTEALAILRAGRS
jgi:sarcosine oxidase subunit alpha